MVQMNPDSATPFKVFLAKVLNHMLPSLSLGSIDSKWVSRDQKQVSVCARVCMSCMFIFAWLSQWLALVIFQVTHQHTHNKATLTSHISLIGWCAVGRLVSGSGRGTEQQ